MRTSDASIPEDERLFRQLKPEHVNGDEVLVGAVDLDGSSVDRELYAPNGPSLSGGCTGYASTTPAVLPTGLVFNGVGYYFFAQDDPIPQNPAHAEIRLSRVEPRDQPKNFKPGSKPVKQQVRKALAARLVVVVAP